MEKEEILTVDISRCLSFIRFLAAAPIEIILIQKFKMSFQIGESSSVHLNDLISKLVLKQYTSTLSEITNAVNTSRYYKAIHIINTVVERAILSGLKNPDIYGVEFKDLKQENGKLFGTFKILR